MGLRESKRVKRMKNVKSYGFKLKTYKKKARTIKLKIRVKLKPLKRNKARILPYPLKKKMKKTIKPLSAHANSLSKILEAHVPNRVIEIKTMCIILSMHLIISPKEKMVIEKKFEDILEKLIEIYSKLEMKPFRVKLLADFKKEFEEIKKSKTKEKNDTKTVSMKSLKGSKIKSKKLFNLIKSYIGKTRNMKRSKMKSKMKQKSRSKIQSKKIQSKKIIHGGRVVELEGDWEEYPPLATMTYTNCVPTSYRVLNLLDADEADEIGREAANGIAIRSTVKWLDKVYGEDHYVCRFWTSGQVIDSEYMEELDNFFENLLPYPNTGTMVAIKGHFFNVVRDEVGQLVFYDLQARWCFENENAYFNPDQYYFVIRNQDFYQFFLSKSPSFGTQRGANIEVICQDYTQANFAPTTQNQVQRTHPRRYAVDTLKQTRIEVSNSPNYYNEANYENVNHNGNYENANYGNGNYNGNYDWHWDNWHNSYNQWYKYSKEELKSIINGRTRITFSESQKENASRFFTYRYGWNGVTREFNENIDNKNNFDEELIYSVPEYEQPIADDVYMKYWQIGFMRSPDITHDRYNFDVYDSAGDIGTYGQVDNPSALDITYNYDTLWTLCSYAKYIRFWINAYMFGQKNINTETFNVNGLKLLLNCYQVKINTLTAYVTDLGVAIEDYSCPIYRDKVGIGHANTFYKIQTIIQKTINLLYTFISNIKSTINRKSGRREYPINERVVNRGKIQQLFVKEATITEFRKVTGDDKGCRFNKKQGGFTMAGGSKTINHIFGGSAMANPYRQRRHLRQGNGAGAANEKTNRRPKERKRKRKEIQKGNDITIIINCALDATCPNQKLSEDYINTIFFERRLMCEPRENLEEIVRVMRQQEVVGIRLKIVRLILPLIELFEFTDLPALTILEYIYANTEEDKEAIVGEKFMDSSFYHKGIEYIFTEEFFDKAMSEEIVWSNYDSFTDPEMSEEENEEIQEHINDMAARYNPEYVIIEEVYGEYSGGYLNSLVPIYISETIIQKPLMTDETRVAVTAFIEGNYTPEYIEKIRTESWPMDEAGFRERTSTSIYEHYSYEDAELY
jgi:hypothetical protein